MEMEQRQSDRMLKKLSYINEVKRSGNCSQDDLKKLLKETNDLEEFPDLSIIRTKSHDQAQPPQDSITVFENQINILTLSQNQDEEKFGPISVHKVGYNDEVALQEDTYQMKSNQDIQDS